jgi:hypothetical protein
MRPIRPGSVEAEPPISEHLSLAAFLAARSPVSQPENLRHAMDRYHAVYLTVLQRHW